MLHTQLSPWDEWNIKKLDLQCQDCCNNTEQYCLITHRAKVSGALNKSRCRWTKQPRIKQQCIQSQEEGVMLLIVGCPQRQIQIILLEKCKKGTEFPCKRFLWFFTVSKNILFLADFLIWVIMIIFFITHLMMKIFLKQLTKALK